MARRWKKKNSWKQVLTVGLVIVVALAGIVGLAKLVDDDHTVLSTAFAKGNLVNGLYVESEEHIYLKDEIAVNNLKIERDFDANVTYKIVFYDENKDFLAETASLDANWNIKDHESDFAADGTFEGAEYARIVIEPIDDENGQISTLEVVQYASQLTITYTK